MSSIDYPMLFQPAYQDYLWGGNTIAETFGRASHPPPPPPVAESWELSDRPEGMSILTNGPWAGTSFAELIDMFGAELLGTRAPAKRFPLLVKILDAHKTLSVQVHPNDQTAAEYGGEAKTEMWHILNAAPDAAVYCGLKPGTTSESLRAAIETNTVESLLNRIPVSAGDTIFVPGGRVHAIAAGCLLLEVQQNSNTTYRLYDWGRVGADSKPRPLHIEQALEVINFADTSSPRVAADKDLICDSKHFKVERRRLKPNTPIHDRQDHTTPESFVALFIATGEVTIGNLNAPAGSTVFLPACLGEFTVTPNTPDTSLLRISLPQKNANR